MIISLLLEASAGVFQSRSKNDDRFALFDGHCHSPDRPRAVPQLGLCLSMWQASAGQRLGVAHVCTRPSKNTAPPCLPQQTSLKAEAAVSVHDDGPWLWLCRGPRHYYRARQVAAGRSQNRPVCVVVCVLWFVGELPVLLCLKVKAKSKLSQPQR